MEDIYTNRPQAFSQEFKRKVDQEARRAGNLGLNPTEGDLQRLEYTLSLQVEIEHHERGENLNAAELRRKTRERLGELTSRYTRLAERAKALAPAYATPKQKFIAEVLIHALHFVPSMAWVMKMLERPAKDNRGRRGRGARQYPLRVFLWMALAQETANVKQTYDSFRANAARAWAMHYPQKGPEYSSLLKTMRSALTRNDVAMVQHAMVDEVRRLADRRDEDGELLVADALAYVKADGTLVRAFLPQRDGIDQTQRTLMRGQRRKHAGFIVYRSKRSFQQNPHHAAGDDNLPEHERADSTEGTGKAKPALITICHGYKVVALHVIRLNVPLIADVFPANVNEREAVLELLDRLFEIWPDCPIYAMAGDSAFDSTKFCDTLVFDYGIQPVFTRGPKYAASYPWHQDTAVTETVEIDGVKHERLLKGINGIPCCDHGVMVRHKVDQFWDAPRRAADSIKRGQPAPSRDARLRWKCAAGICKGRATYPRRNARLYTYYPRLSLEDLEQIDNDNWARINDEWEAEKAAAAAEGRPAPDQPARPNPVKVHGTLPLDRILLNAYGNTIESLWSQMKGNFSGNSAPVKAAWAGDTEMRWLIMVSLLGIVARRVAHLDGLYEQSLAEAAQLSVDQWVTAENPQAGPTAEQYAEVRSKRQPFPVRPASWRGDGLLAIDCAISEHGAAGDCDISDADVA
jgi:hypothetical protein